MTFDELMTEQKIRLATENKPQLAHRAAAEAMVASRRSGLRRTMATALVRAGGWLDRGAIERALTVRRELSR